MSTTKINVSPSSSAGNNVSCSDTETKKKKKKKVSLSRRKGRGKSVVSGSAETVGPGTQKKTAIHTSQLNKQAKLLSSTTNVCLRNRGDANTKAPLVWTSTEVPNDQQDLLKRVSQADLSVQPDLPQDTNSVGTPTSFTTTLR